MWPWVRCTVVFILQGESCGRTRGWPWLTQVCLWESSQALHSLFSVLTQPRELRTLWKRLQTQLAGKALQDSNPCEKFLVLQLGPMWLWSILCENLGACLTSLNLFIFLQHTPFSIQQLSPPEVKGGLAESAESRESRWRTVTWCYLAPGWKYTQFCLLVAWRPLEQWLQDCP